MELVKYLLSVWRFLKEIKIMSTGSKWQALNVGGNDNRRLWKTILFGDVQIPPQVEAMPSLHAIGDTFVLPDSFEDFSVTQESIGTPDSIPPTTSVGC